MTRVAKIARKTEYFPIICEIKETNDEKYQIGGYLNYIGNIDFGDDRTMKGAFDLTLRDSFARKSAQSLDFLWPYLWNHDYNILPPGGIYDADEDKKGLYTKVQFNPETQLGRELYSSFKIGTMKKQSMGYKTIKYEYVKEGGRTIRNLIEVAVVEGSAVVFPMNDLAAVDTVKSTRRYFVMPGQKPVSNVHTTIRLDGQDLARLTPGQKPATKDFNATYQERMQEDWLDDLWNLWYSLKSEIVNAFRIGDQPVEDCQAALDQFSQAMLAYVQQGVDLGMVEALQPDDDDCGNGSYGWMSGIPERDAKAGRILSQENHALLTKAVKGIEGHTKEIKSLLTAAQQQGYPAMGAPAPVPQGKQEDGPGDDAVSTHLGELLAGLQLASLGRQLKTK